MKYLVLILLCGLISCVGNNTQTLDPISELSKQTGRDSWQKPELVIDAIGNTSNKIIADIGAGTGYFTFRLAFSAQKVIAIEIDQQMIELIELFRVNLPPEIKERIETRLVNPTNTGLQDNEVDIAVIINTIGYIKNPVSYLIKLKKGIAMDGSIAIVDFKNKYLTIDAPPMEDRIPSDSIVSYLRQSGFKDIEINDKTLDFQYIITAHKHDE
jgi:ubiquinone/menaquinone biosynthesis C-methylase UbiE